MAGAPLTVKVDFDGDLRRLRFNVPEDTSPAEKHRALRDLISRGFGWSDEGAGIVLKYRDDEQDLCTLVEASMEDFLSLDARPLRLVACRATLGAAQSSGSAPPLKAQPAMAAEPVQSDQMGGSCGGGFFPDSPPCMAAAGMHGIGPWRLLACLRGLHDAEMMTSKMVGSMIIQFLPILTQRAHRKQEKVNRLGPEKREFLLPLARSVQAQLHLMPEAQALGPALEDYISGRDDTKLGDFLAALCKALSTSKDRQAVIDFVNAVADEILRTLPQVLPSVFDGPGGRAQHIAEHTGIRCTACGCEPILGPRFYSPEAGVNLCGNCFIDQGPGIAEGQFECHFMPHTSEDGEDSYRGGETWWRDGGCGRKRSWKEDDGAAAGWKHFKGKGWPHFFKGKGKGKGKCKGKFFMPPWWVHPYDMEPNEGPALEPTVPPPSEPSEAASEAQDPWGAGGYASGRDWRSWEGPPPPPMPMFPPMPFWAMPPMGHPPHHW